MLQQQLTSVDGFNLYFNSQFIKKTSSIRINTFIIIVSCKAY